MGQVDDFKVTRERLNDLLLKHADTSIKRFLSLDNQIYRDGALPSRTKELLGLVSSLVLRCDDCVRYHLTTCHELGFSTEEIMEALSVGLVVGGSIVIPHLRRATEFWGELSHSSTSER